MRRLKALLRRRSFDEGSAVSTKADNRRVTPLDTRRSLDSPKQGGKLEDPRRNNGTGSSRRAGTLPEYNTDAQDRSKPPGHLHSGSISNRPNEQRGPAELPLETIKEAQSQTKQYGDTETEVPPNPSSTAETTTGRGSGNPSIRRVDNERNNPPAIYVGDKEKAPTSETQDTEEVYEDCVETHSPPGVIPDLTNTTDTDETTTYAPGE